MKEINKLLKEYIKLKDSNGNLFGIDAKQYYSWKAQARSTQPLSKSLMKALNKMASKQPQFPVQFAITAGWEDKSDLELALEYALTTKPNVYYKLLKDLELKNG